MCLCVYVHAWTRVMLMKSCCIINCMVLVVTLKDLHGSRGESIYKTSCQHQAWHHYPECHEFMIIILHTHNSLNHGI